MLEFPFPRAPFLCFSSSPQRPHTPAPIPRPPFPKCEGITSFQSCNRSVTNSTIHSNRPLSLNVADSSLIALAASPENAAHRTASFPMILHSRCSLFFRLFDVLSSIRSRVLVIFLCFLCVLTICFISRLESCRLGENDNIEFEKLISVVIPLFFVRVWWRNCMMLHWLVI